MSKEKMDRYKAAKANKEEIRKKQKKNKFFTRLIWCIALVIVVGLIGLGIYVSIPDKSATSADASQTINLEDLLQSVDESSAVDVVETEVSAE